MPNLHQEILDLKTRLEDKTLPWQDCVRAIVRLHTLYISTNSNWNVERTAKSLDMTRAYVYKTLQIASYLQDLHISKATSLDKAHNIIQRLTNGRDADEVEDIVNVSKTLFAVSPPLVAEDEADADVSSALAIQADFPEWAATYSGPKFSFIHCDFPYIDSTILSTLTSNLTRIMSFSAHLMLWFDMSDYVKVQEALHKADLTVHTHPLIWHRTDCIDTTLTYVQPYKAYYTALLAIRGNRPFIRSISNAYAAPIGTATNHGNKKSEPMLRHFFKMFIDETTSMLDPTCGNGSALCAAQALSAKRILGLDQNKTCVDHANAALAKANSLRAAQKLVKLKETKS